MGAPRREPPLTTRRGMRNWGLAAVEALLRRDNARVDGTHAARFDGRRRAAGLIPIAGPLPHIAGHVVQSVPIRRKCADWRSSLMPVGEQILPRELALPPVG